MGIYQSDDIYGIKIYNFNSDNIYVCNILYEKISDSILSAEIMKEAREFYDGLNDTDKGDALFQVYTKCTMTINSTISTTMMWFPISLETFLLKFNK